LQGTSPVAYSRSPVYCESTQLRNWARPWCLSPPVDPQLLETTRCRWGRDHLLKHRRQGDCRVHDSVHESVSFFKSTVEQASANRQPVEPSYDQHSLYDKMGEYTDMEQCKKTQYDSKSRLQCTYTQLSTTLEDLRARQVPQVAVNYHICSPGPMHDIRALY
jgi:hypothetical protein